MKKEFKTSISTKLLRVLMPMVAVSIVFIILFISLRARGIITGMAQDSLESESGKNAAEISAEITTLLATCQDASGDLNRYE